MTPTRPWHPPDLTAPRAVTSITARQADVLDGLCEGLTNAQIGRRLYITEETVKSHARDLFAALGARDRGHAVALTVTGHVIVHVRGAA